MIPKKKNRKEIKKKIKNINWKERGSERKKKGEIKDLMKRREWI